MPSWSARATAACFASTETPEPERFCREDEQKVAETAAGATRR